MNSRSKPNSFKTILMLLSILISVQMMNASDSAKHPHIVLLIGDDHGFPYFGFMGDHHVVTPAMDTLSKGGITFTQGFTTAPYCRPSLRSIITGLQPVQYSLREAQILKGKKDTRSDFESLDDMQKHMWHAVEKAAAMKEFDTLPKMLAQIGYTSWQGGKWWENSYKNGHFTHGMTKGWDMSKFGTDDFFHEMMGSEGNELGRTTMKPLYDYIDQNSDDPMFIWYGPMLPHTPLDAPYKYQKYYEHQDLSESAKAYYANISWWDDGVGQLMDYMEAKGILDDTLFIYISDNGWEQDAKVEYKSEGATYQNNTLFANGGIRGKSGLHDQSFRTPIIFYQRNTFAAAFNEESLVSMVDIVPTILELVGIGIPTELPGRSLKNALTREGKIDERDHIVGYTDNRRSDEDMMGQAHEGYFLRTHKWHFIYHRSTGEMELYDMQKDEQSDHNVIEQHPELIHDFKLKIERWRKDMGMNERVSIS